MKNIELKPCPFCGGDAEIVTTVTTCRTAIAYVQCKKCDTKTKTYGDFDHDGSYIFIASKAWNRRATE